MVDDRSEHIKVKTLNKNAILRIGHSEQKDVLLNNKCFRHSMT